MEKMGFDRKCISLVMACISSVSYSILVNGELRGNVKPSRGIRQGDPLSPFLFLLCSEGLNGLINKVVIDGKMRNFSLYKNGLQISHLFLQMKI